MKKSKGITLIALVITIIVLIILAGISINLLFNDNGILQKAKDSQVQQAIAEYKEQIELAKADARIETKNDLTLASIKEALDRDNQKNWNTEMINSNNTIKLTTKEGYVFYITEDATECNGTGEVELPIGVESVVLDFSNKKINIGDEVTLSATINPSNASNKNITWTSGDDSIATVLNGKVTGISSGTVTITATSIADNTKKATCTVKVKNPNILYEDVGLYIWLDGINNTRSGHSSTTTTWSNLVGTEDYNINLTTSWNSNCLNFTQGYVDLGNINNNLSTFTIEAVISGANGGAVISNWNSGGFALWNSAFSIRKNQSGNDINSTITGTSISGTALLTATYDGSEMQYFINGNKINSLSSNFINSSSNTHLGIDPGADEAGWYAGNIHSIRIYNRKLSDAEILENYNVDCDRFNIE